jgi:hypothetical protein
LKKGWLAQPKGAAMAALRPVLWDISCFGCRNHGRGFLWSQPPTTFPRLPPELLRRGRFDELFFVDLPTPDERREIIAIYIKSGLKREFEPSLLDELVQLSEGFAGCDLQSAVREVVKEAFRKSGGRERYSRIISPQFPERICRCLKPTRRRLKRFVHGDVTAPFQPPASQLSIQAHQ